MIRALIFDINGTVADILTDETMTSIYRTLANFLRYACGIDADERKLHERYFALNRRQRQHNAEAYPEFDVVRLFRELLAELPEPRIAGGTPPDPVMFAQLFRAASRLRLELYPGVRDVLDILRQHYILAAVSDGQRLWADAEIAELGLDNYFCPVIVSSDFGFRKPDRRLFEAALDALSMAPREAVYIGNDMYRDVRGAHKAGLKTVFVESNQGERKFSGVKPDAFIRDFRELPGIVADWNA